MKSLAVIASTNYDKFTKLSYNMLRSLFRDKTEEFHRMSSFAIPTEYGLCRLKSSWVGLPHTGGRFPVVNPFPQADFSREDPKYGIMNYTVKRKLSIDSS
jgi:hypothetical protein